MAICLIMFNQTARADLFQCKRLYVVTVHLGKASVTKEPAQLVLNVSNQEITFKVNGNYGIGEPVVVNNKIVLHSESFRMRKSEMLLTHTVNNHLPAPSYISQYRCK